MFNIGVKYCGNCNPIINSKKLLETVAKYLPDHQFVAPGAGIDALLILSGCETDCAARPHLQVETIVVAGLTVDCVACKEEDLPLIINNKLLNIRRG